jgi:hypothetical protein
MKWVGLFAVVFLVGCKGEMGPVGPAGPQGAAGPVGAAGPAGAPGSLNRAVGTAVIAGDGVASFALPTAIPRTTRPDVTCYTTDNPANDAWLFVGGLSTGEPNCAMVWNTTQNRWIAAMLNGTPGWTALFIATW